MRHLLLSITLLLAFTNISFAQYEYIYMHDPMQPWYHSPIAVNETTIDIYPKGTFYEVELFISFSATEPSIFDEENFLEMVTNFELSENVAVSDLWLWFGDEILVAHIIDRWSANRIYESIVERQQDPAILFKNSPTSYELKVYPFTSEEIRKLKFSFLIPGNLSDNTSSEVSLPTKFHQLAEQITGDATIRFFTEDDNHTFSISEDEGAVFSSGTDSLGRTYYETSVASELLPNGLTVEHVIDEPDLLLTNYADSSEKYYSFSLIPGQVLNIGSDKNVVIIMDFTAANSTYSKAEFLETVKEGLKNSFSASDNFNLVYSSLSARLASETWVNGSDVAIDSLFELIDVSSFSGNSNLDDHLAESFDFLDASAEGGEILLISSSDTYHSVEDANEFAEAVLDYVDGNLPQINIVDIQDVNYSWFWRNGKNYRGNEYLYGILSRESGGELFDYNYSNDVSTRLNAGFNILDGKIYNFDVYSTFNAGFSYSRYHNQHSARLPVSATYTQTGKYYGELPLTIQFSGTFRDSVFNEQIVVEASEEMDSTLKRYWVGREIDNIERNFPSNAEIATAIDYSIENRIMSQYTSFLALEPGDSTLLENEEGDVIDTSVENDLPESFKIDSVFAYPNPFNPTVNIGVELTQPWNSSNSSIIIYNMLGQVVAKLNTSQFDGSRTFRVQWDVHRASSSIATGVYLVRVVTPYANKNLKITYLK